MYCFSKSIGSMYILMYALAISYAEAPWLYILAKSALSDTTLVIHFTIAN